MIPASKLLRDSAVYSQTTDLTVDVLRGNSVVYPDIPITDGKFTSDRGSKVRMVVDLTVSLANHPNIKINNQVHRVRIKRGYTSLGIGETIQHGIFRIDEAELNDDESLDLSCSGLESYIVDARFVRPRVPPYGVSTVGHIRDLIQEILPGQKVVAECSRDKPVQATAPWDKERWDAVDSLAASIDAEVYADYRGYFVIRDIPALTKGVVVYKIAPGSGGTLRTRKVKNTRDRVYNAAVVFGQSSDPNIPPVWGWAYDSRPDSPTYFYGDFGQVPRFFSSQFFTTNSQCTAAAVTQLAQALAINESLSVDALPLTFLEPGDVIQVVMADNTIQKRLLEKISFNLGYDAGVSIETLLMKDLDDDES